MVKSIRASWIGWGFVLTAMASTVFGQTEGSIETGMDDAIVVIQLNLDQLQNGTISTTPEWANGNINTTNSCYSEGDGVPYRYFIDGLTGGTSHYFTISMEWTKAGVHAFDYLTSVDASEAAAIATAGGVCGAPSTPPGDCSGPTDSLAWADPRDSANYTGAIPGDFFTIVNPGFSWDSPGYLHFYNAVVDSVSAYSFAGSPSDREWRVTVYFTAVNTGSAGFYWAGHLALGTSGGWGLGGGSASVGGAPYHMRVVGFDGGGGANQDRSVQNGSVCLPPDVAISCTQEDTLCAGDEYTCSVAAGSDDYVWTVNGGTITGGQGTNAVTFTVTVPVGGSVTVGVEACNMASACPGDFCCSENMVTLAVKDCYPCPTVSCPGDTSVFVCGSEEICIPGFVCSDEDNNIVSCSPNIGALVGDELCFTPDTSGVYTLRLIALDGDGCADTCAMTVTVTINEEPAVTCPGNISLDVCSLTPICLTGFGCSDADGNVTSTTVSLGTLDGDSVCFTPVAGANTIILTCTDSCGATASCTTVVTVTVNASPVISVGADIDTVLCTQTLCLPYIVSDPDGAAGLIETLVSGPAGATIDTAANQVCVGSLGGSATLTFVVQVSDACGALDRDTIVVTTEVNEPPTISGSDKDTVMCAPGQVCLPYTVGDPNGVVGLTETLVSAPVGGTIDTALNRVCVTVAASGIYEFVVRVEDSCGLADQDTLQLTAHVNVGPVVMCPGNFSLAVCDFSPICLTGFSASDADGNLASTVLSLGTLGGDSLCFTPSAGINTIILTATDSCGLTASCTTVVTVTINAPAHVSLGADIDTALCTPYFCLPYTVTDADGLAGVVETLVSGPAGTTIDTLSNLICFTAPSGASTLTFVVEVTDECGPADRDTIVVQTEVNGNPTIDGVNKDTVLCAAGEICLPYVVSDPNGPGGLVESLFAGPMGGTIDTAANEVCLTVSASGVYVFTLKVMDECGVAAYDSVFLAAHLNGPPQVSFGPDKALNLCSPTQFCETYTPADPDGLSDIASEMLVSAPPGTVFDTLQNKVCYTPPGTGVYSFVVRVTDKCGIVDQDTIVVSVTVNQAPVVALDAESILAEMCLGTDSVICLSYAVSDQAGDKVIETLVSGNATIDTSANTICLSGDASGTFQIIVQVADSCGVMDRDTAIVQIDRNLCCPSVTIEKAHDVFQGAYTCIDITMQGGAFVMGGFNFLIAYDASALSPSTVEPGALILDCGWEYFTFRLGANGNCVGCPSGLIEIVAIAETSNGPNHPDCFGPSSADTVQLASICFLVTNDRTFECQYVPVRFFWMDCGDNSLSNKSGDTLFVSDDVYDYDIVNPVTDGSAGFPTYFGVQDVCFLPGEKMPILQCTDFYNGGIDIVCADSIDARGDLNLNGTAYEIADAVLYSNYFVYGLGVFDHYEGQVAASDVNADGIPVSVADLVYLIRVVVGDAQPYPKHVSPVRVAVENVDGVLSVDGEVLMGAAFLTVAGDVTPTLLAENMEMKYAFDPGSNMTRVLVYSLATEGFVGEFIRVPGVVRSLELATYEGYPVVTKAVQAGFALSQNYPNPFNPTTTISFGLPTASDYTLTIYNVQGQVVKVFAGQGHAGENSVMWEAGEQSSGVYMYKLEAGDYAESRKMLLVK